MSGDLSVEFQAAYALFLSLPEAARAELAVELNEIGSAVLAQQQALAPVLAEGNRRKSDPPSGQLRAALTVQEAIGVMRVRVGILNMKTGRHPLFYAMFQEFGRRAQEVWVRRLKVGGRKVWLGRKGVSRREKPLDLIVQYRMRVRAMAAKHFIHVDEGAIVNQRLADFWDRVIARAEGSAA